MIAWRPAHARQRDFQGFVFGLVCLGAAAVAAYELVHGSERLAVAFTLVPLAVCLLTRPAMLLVPLGASIPAIMSVTGSSSYAAGGFNVAVSDLLLVMISGGILIQSNVTTPLALVQALRPVKYPVAQYGAVMVLLLSFHGFHDLVKTGQRFELFLVPLLVGVYAAFVGAHIRVLKAYVIASTALAFVFPFYDFGLQHNPVGQMIANGVLVLVGVRSLRRLYPCFAILVPGLILTGSRGAILAAAVGIAVIFAMQNISVRRFLTRSLPVVVLAVGVFLLAPSSLRDRLTTVSAGTQSRAAYALLIRQQEAGDAHRIVAEHPWTGVGIGNYYAADVAIDPSGAVQDPHDVLLLQEAEGGYILEASFIILVAGVAFALWRIRKVDIAPAAAGVLLASVVHGLVDVYWVRGTPVIGWLIVGMVCGALVRQRESVATA